MLADLSADLTELHQELNRCRSLVTRRRLTHTVAQMAGLMCLALIKLDERSAFRAGHALPALLLARLAMR